MVVLLCVHPRVYKILHPRVHYIRCATLLKHNPRSPNDTETFKEFCCFPFYVITKNKVIIDNEQQFNSVHMDYGLISVYGDKLVHIDIVLTL